MDTYQTQLQSYRLPLHHRSYGQLQKEYRLILIVADIGLNFNRDYFSTVAVAILAWLRISPWVLLELMGYLSNLHTNNYSLFKQLSGC